MDKRSRILSSGIKVFAEHGFAGATVDQIAAAAEVSVGTIYNYFASKDDLLKQAIAGEFEKRCVFLKQSVDSYKGHERLASFLRWHLREVEANPLVSKVILQEKRLILEWQRTGHIPHQGFAELVDSLLSDVIEPGNTRSMVAVLIHGMAEAVTQRVVLSEQDERAALVMQGLETMTHILTKGLY